MLLIIIIIILNTFQVCVNTHLKGVPSDWFRNMSLRHKSEPRTTNRQQQEADVEPTPVQEAQKDPL